MIVSIHDVKHLPRFEYDQLPEGAKPAARQAILDDWENAVRRAKDRARAVAKANVNAAVNNPHHITSIARDLAFVRRLKSDTPHLEKHILGNLCHFLQDGAYIRYMPDEG